MSVVKSLAWGMNRRDAPNEERGAYALESVEAIP